MKKKIENQLAIPSKREIDAYWEAHKDDEDVKILTESLTDSLKVFYLTEDEIKEKIKEIVCSRDIETAQKLNVCIQNLAFEELNEFVSEKDEETIAKRKKFAKDALSALLDVHILGCGEVRDSFFEVVQSAKSEFNINAMALTKKTLMSSATLKKYDRAVEAIFVNEKWAELGIEFTKEEFKNMVEKCTTILYSTRKEVVNEVLDVLSQFSKDDKGNFVFDIKSIIKNCSTLLLATPKKLQATINFLSENYDRTDVVENVRFNGSLLMINPDNVKEYEQKLAECLDRVCDNYAALSKDTKEDAKKSCSLSKLNQIDKFTDKKLDNMQKIVDVLIKNKIDPDTTYYAVKNLTITSQIDAKKLDAFLCHCIANEDKGGRELMREFFKSPALAVENSDTEGQTVTPPTTGGKHIKNEDENVDAHCGLTKEEALEKLQGMGDFFEGQGEGMFKLINEKIKNRKKRKSPSKTVPPKTDGDDREPKNGHNGKPKPEKEVGVEIPDFSDCVDDVPFIELSNRLFKFCEANGIKLTDREIKCFKSLKPAFMKMCEADKSTNFKDLEEFHSLIAQMPQMFKEQSTYSERDAMQKKHDQFFQKCYSVYNTCKKQVEQVEKEVRSVPEYKVVRDFMKKMYGKVRYFDEDGNKVKKHYRNTYVLNDFLTFELKLTISRLQEKGIPEDAATVIMDNYVFTDDLIAEHSESRYADNNLAIYRTALSKNLLDFVQMFADTQEYIGEKSKGNEILKITQTSKDKKGSFRENSQREDRLGRYANLNNLFKSFFANFLTDDTVKDVREINSYADFGYFVYDDQFVYCGECEADKKIDLDDLDRIFLGVPKTVEDDTLEKIGCERLLGSPIGRHEDGKTK